jgi:hypothetical protein
MGFCGCNSLSIEDRLDIAENNLTARDCVKAAAALSQVEKNGKRALNNPTLKGRIARAYRDLGNLQKQLRRPEEEVKESRRLAQQWGYR